MASGSTVFVLLGFPGTGKLTVARAITDQLRTQGREVRVVDNHYINNPIFGIIDQDGVTPLPLEVWDRVEEVRAAVFETIRSVSPRSWSFVFTYDLVDRPKDRRWFDQLVDLAAQRDSQLVTVRLLCDLDELCRRVISPERKDLMKSMSVEELRQRYQVEEVLDPGDANTLTLDITETPPEEAASRIVAHVAKKQVQP